MDKDKNGQISKKELIDGYLNLGSKICGLYLNEK